ncbi:hypothetical protein B7494_g6312 [Chlorociboria aeruginascens]|nr:hypothetical protein B7494_g6312 [Chlorociboria aeruginascens]
MPLPSLLVFGPQINRPSSQYLSALREYLLQEQSLSSFVEAIRDLRNQWQVLLNSNPELIGVVGATAIDEILEWLDHGKSCWTSNVPSAVFTTPFTVIVHITQYFQFLSLQDPLVNHEQLIENLKLGGIQGFCTGWLSAVALACSANEQELVTLAGVALRLALGIGAYVDLYSDTSDAGRSTCLAVQLKLDSSYVSEDFVKEFPDAYISTVYDSQRFTITASAPTIDILTSNLSSQGIVARPLDLRGFFHYSKLKAGVESLEKLCDSNNEFSFPDAERLLVPLRSNKDGSIVSQGSLHWIALQSILVDLCRWDKTLSASVQEFGHLTSVPVAVFSLGECLPHSIFREKNLKIARLDNFPLSSSGNLSKYPTKNRYPEHAVAIIGMACQYPGADSTDEFWDIIASGESMLGELPPGRFDPKKLHRTKSGKSIPEAVFRGNFIKDPKAFDHRFFKKSSREAASMDPQQRLLLQVSYQALESSGYHGQLWHGTKEEIGCFIGVASSDYEDNVSSHPSNAFSLTGTQRAFLSGKISYNYGWTGPSITYDTACSASLVAIHSACKALQTGECSAALAGGVNVITSPNLTLNLAGASFLSPTGGCKSFDAKADGYSRGEGAGLIVLKLLSQAITDKDSILGVIAGSAVNQNKNASPITVPHSPSQTSLYNKVSTLAGIDTSDISYVEAHGTGTLVGDPIECASIRTTFAGPSRKKTLYLGSVKGNIGHTEAASGVASVIKTVLMMRHRTIPPQANFISLNPTIPALEPSNMMIATKAHPWESNFLAAFVNNYGAAGSNAALILCEPPRPYTHRAGKQESSSEGSSSAYPIVISAQSTISLSLNIEAFKVYISKILSDTQHSNILSDLSFSLAMNNNRGLPYIWSTTTSSLYQLYDQLKGKFSNPKPQFESPNKPVVLVFGPQTGDMVSLNSEIYKKSQLLRSHLDRCDKIIRSMAFEGLYPYIFDLSPIDDLVTLHCALFSLQYSCAQAWIDSGLKVDAVMGHSFGELTALCISGVLSLEDGIKLISGRAKLMQEKWGDEKGSMMVVEADFETVQRILSHFTTQESDGPVDIACHNGPTSHVLVGSIASIESLYDSLKHQTLPWLGRLKLSKMKVARGFHSRFTEDLLPDLHNLAQGLDFREPTIRLETCTENVSCEVFDASMISNHTRKPVFFTQAVERLADSLGHCIWLEAGTDSPVIDMVRRKLSQSASVDFHSLQTVKFKTQDVIGSLAETTVNLWNAGQNVNFWLHHRCQANMYNRIELPPYQFDRSQHWLDYVDSPGLNLTETPAPVEAGAGPLILFNGLLDRPTSPEALFSINPEHELFKLLAAGHCVLGFPLCPASLYLELVEQALRIIVPESTDFLVWSKDVEFKAPLGLSSDRSISLSLIQKDGASSEWTFTVNSQKNGTAFEHVAGRIGIQPLESSENIADFARFERLINYERLDALLTLSEAQAMRGSLIYQVFSSIVDYADFFQGVKSVSSNGREIAGEIVLPSTAIGALDQTVSSPVLSDSFIQVAGLHMNVLLATDKDHMFIASKVDLVQPSSIFKRKREIGQSSWSVYSSFSQVGKSEYVNDIFVFDPETKKLVLMIMGMHFTKIPSKSVKNALANINQSIQENANMPNPLVKRPQHAPIRAKGHPLKHEKLRDKLSTPLRDQRYEASEALSLKVRKLISKILDIPLLDLHDNTTIDSLGIDSLMLTEVLEDLRAEFEVEIPSSIFVELKDISSLSQYLRSKGESADNIISNSESATVPHSTPFINRFRYEEFVPHPTMNGFHNQDIIDRPTANSFRDEDVIARLRNLVKDHLEMSDPMTDKTSLRDLGMDSLIGMELVSDINAAFGIVLDSHVKTEETTFEELASSIMSQKYGIAIRHMAEFSSPSGETTLQASSFPSPMIAPTLPVPDISLDSILLMKNGTSHSLIKAQRAAMVTVTFKRVDGLDLDADIYYPPANQLPQIKYPIALMIHGGGHAMLSRKDVRPKQTQLLHEKGFLPVSIDYRLCPEVDLLNGPMKDVRDALDWARSALPSIAMEQRGIIIDSNNVVAVGWSTGGTLAMTLGWTPLQFCMKPIQGVLAFYCPSDYEDPFWKTPNLVDKYPSLDLEKYDIRDGVNDKPITGYNVPAELRAVDGWINTSDARSRIPLLMNIKALTLPLLVRGLPAKSSPTRPDLSIPTTSEIIPISPFAQIQRETYSTPTFIIHGTEDDLIPWQQAKRTYDALVKRGIRSELRILRDRVHLFDLGMGGGGDDEEWGSIKEGYEFLDSCVV